MFLGADPRPAYGPIPRKRCVAHSARGDGDRATDAGTAPPPNEPRRPVTGKAPPVGPGGEWRQYRIFCNKIKEFNQNSKIALQYVSLTHIEPGKPRKFQRLYNFHPAGNPFVKQLPLTVSAYHTKCGQGTNIINFRNRDEYGPRTIKTDQKSSGNKICSLVNLSDYSNRPQNERDNVGLTRALAAFALSIQADISDDIAANSIVDGFNDNGLDSIYYSASDKVLYFVQSKWSNDGTGSIDQGSVEKFVRGVRDMLALKIEHFNDKLKNRQAELESAVNNTLRIVLVVVHSGSDRLGDHPKRVLSEFLDELNDTGEVATLHNMSQVDLYSIVAQGGRGDPANVSVQLFDWGQTKAPYMAFYGQVAASDVAQWGTQFRHRIFSKNIRSFLGGSTAVNEGIADSVRKTPSHFWYLNNGITALCGSIRKRPIGGASHDAGTFDCDDVSIVNGAQTVGVISELAAAMPKQLEQARVPIRLISLEGCPPEFAMEVTRATNTQNRVDSRNFVALDPQQDRLRAELLIDGIEYEFRQGEGEPHGTARFGLVDATVALACAQAGPELAVQAKREISKLWEDLSRAPYKSMFNSSLTGLRLWHLVQVLREIDRRLTELRENAMSSKEKNLVSHANRLTAHMVMRRLKIETAGTTDFQISNIYSEIETLTPKLIRSVQEVVDKNYSDSYLAVLFKNSTKCRDIVIEIDSMGSS